MLNIGYPIIYVNSLLLYDPGFTAPRRIRAIPKNKTYSNHSPYLSEAILGYSDGTIFEDHPSWKINCHQILEPTLTNAFGQWQDITGGSYGLRHPKSFTQGRILGHWRTVYTHEPTLGTWLCISPHHPWRRMYTWPFGRSIPIEFLSLGWFKGKSTGNHGFYHQI